jgi:hypothetical protein
MKKLLLVGLPIMLLMPVLAMAQSDFGGTWKIDLNKAVMPDRGSIRTAEPRRRPTSVPGRALHRSVRF